MSKKEKAGTPYRAGDGESLTAQIKKLSLGKRISIAEALEASG